jgi:tetratricopeptide (TPR) repeat protein
VAARHYQLEGVASYYQGRLQSAIAAFTEANRHMSDDPSVEHLLPRARFALAHAEAEDFLAARQDLLAEAALHRALTISPTSIAALNQLGRLLMRSGRLEEAAQIYQRAIAVAPDLAWSRYDYALLMGQMGEIDEARQRARTLQKEYPQLVNDAALSGLFAER